MFHSFPIPTIPTDPTSDVAATRDSELLGILKFLVNEMRHGDREALDPEVRHTVFLFLKPSKANH